MTPFSLPSELVQAFKLHNVLLMQPAWHPPGAACVVRSICFVSCACQCAKIDVTDNLSLKCLIAPSSHKCLPCCGADCGVCGHAVGQGHGGLLEY